MDLETIAKHVTPLNVLKWASVIFLVVLYVLIIVAIILSMAGVF